MFVVLCSLCVVHWLSFAVCCVVSAVCKLVLGALSVSVAGVCLLLVVR